MRKLGAGTLLVNGIAGQLVIKEGTLGGNGTLAHLTVRDGGTVAPGASIGALNVANSFTMETGATLSIEIGGIAPGEFDQLLVDAVAMLAGSLNVELIDFYQPQAGDSIPFLVAQGGAGGAFDTLDLPTLRPNLQWQLNFGDDSVFLLVNSTLAGDFDNDGDVDDEDLAAWETGYRMSGAAGRADGDADGDADVDGNDFLIWQQQAGIGQVFLEAGSTTLQEVVPEPMANVLMAMGMLLSQLGRRCRRNHRFMGFGA